MWTVGVSVRAKGHLSAELKEALCQPSLGSGRKRKKRGSLSEEEKGYCVLLPVAERLHPTVSKSRLTRVAQNSIRLCQDLIQVFSIQSANLWAVWE